jgi:hypothetical protein
MKSNERIAGTICCVGAGFFIFWGCSIFGLKTESALCFGIAGFFLGWVRIASAKWERSQ